MNNQLSVSAPLLNKEQINNVKRIFMLFEKQVQNPSNINKKKFQSYSFIMFKIFDVLHLQHQQKYQLYPLITKQQHLSDVWQEKYAEKFAELLTNYF